MSDYLICCSVTNKYITNSVQYHERNDGYEQTCC